MKGPKTGPSYRELAGKLKEAKEILAKARGLFVDPGKAAFELSKLDIKTSEVWPLIVSLLSEITPEYYAGSRPPQLSYEEKIKGKSLFAFSFPSICMGCQMYLKFAIKDNRYYYVSLHRDNPPKKRS